MLLDPLFYPLVIFFTRGAIRQASHPGRFTVSSVIPPPIVRSRFAKQLIPNHLKKLPKSE
jgi:hypothetical protein